MGDGMYMKWEQWRRLHKIFPKMRLDPSLAAWVDSQLAKVRGEARDQKSARVTIENQEIYLLVEMLKKLRKRIKRPYSKDKFDPLDRVYGVAAQEFPNLKPKDVENRYHAHKKYIKEEGLEDAWMDYIYNPFLIQRLYAIALFVDNRRRWKWPPSSSRHWNAMGLPNGLAQDIKFDDYHKELFSYISS